MEKSYLISFEIADRTTLIKVTDAIKMLGKWWNHMENIWIIRTDTTAKTIKVYLNVFLNENDKLIILGLDGDGEWTGLENPAVSWLTNFVIK